MTTASGISARQSQRIEPASAVVCASRRPANATTLTGKRLSTRDRSVDISFPLPEPYLHCSHRSWRLYRHGKYLSCRTVVRGRREQRPHTGHIEHLGHPLPGANHVEDSAAALRRAVCLHERANSGGVQEGHLGQVHPHL